MCSNPHLSPTPGVTLWRARYSTLPNLIAAPDSLLDDGERARAQRLIDAKRRVQFVLGRAFLRVMLARVLTVDAAALRFVYGTQGKPMLPEGDVRFNLSHAGDCLALGITHGREIGVDVEQIRAIAEMVTMVRDNFSAAEQAAFFALPPANQQAAFFCLWTRKEAYIKARGTGFALSSRSFTLSLDAPPRLLAADDDTPWTLRDFDAGAGYTGALCIAGDALPVVIHDFAG